MPALHIPDDHKLGFSRLLSLSDEDATELVAALKDSVGVPPRECSAAIASRLPQLGSDADAIFRTLESLYQARAHFERAPDRFVGDLIEAISTEGTTELGQLAADTGKVRDRLKLLLGIESLALRSKAFVLGRDYDHILHETKVLTDLRPVFDDVNATPRGFVVSQQLKVVYHDGRRHVEIYFALDAKDLANLRETLERAQQKADTLTKWLSEVNSKAFID